MGSGNELYAIYGIKGDYGNIVDQDWVDTDSEPKKYLIVVPNEFSKPENREGQLVLINDTNGGNEYCYFGLLLFKGGDERMGEAKNVRLAYSGHDFIDYQTKFWEEVDEYDVNVHYLLTLGTLKLHIFNHAT